MAGTCKKTSHEGVAAIEFMEKLPTEIRTRILKEYLTMPGSIDIGCYHESAAIVKTWGYPSHRTIWGTGDVVQKPVLNLLLVNKTIYREASQIYFSQNTFKFGSPKTFNDFAIQVGPICRWSMRKMCIRWGGSSKVDAAKALRGFVGLRELKLSFVALYKFKTTKIHVQEPQISTYGHKELLRLRGLTRFEVGFSGCIQVRGREDEYRGQKEEDAFMQSFDIVKLPYAVKTLEELRLKDFGKQPAD